MEFEHFNSIEEAIAALGHEKVLQLIQGYRLDSVRHYSADTSPSITWSVREISHSCTGPVEIILEFRRDLLQNLEVGDETVTVILTEPVI